jgi:parvulin-like peptidyl-prolyl isomerase
MGGTDDVPGRGIVSIVGRVPVAAGAAVLLAAVIGLVVVLLTRGDDAPKIPAGAVAVVGDRPITSASLSHWESIYSRAATAANTTKPTTGQARKAAFAMIAGFAWIEQEADRQAVTVTKAQLDSAMKAFFDQYQGTSKEQILSQMGSSEADMRTQQRVSLLATALQTKVAKTVSAPSAQQIQTTYRAEPERWAHPSKRDVRVVVAASEKNAQAAAKALASGTSFADANKKYSSDSQLANAGGALKGLKPGSTDAAFERAVFKAPVHELVGPVATSSGWVVFKVQRVTPLADRTLGQATTAIRQELTGAAQSKAVDKYLAGMRTYWRARTHCTDTVSNKDYCTA